MARVLVDNRWVGDDGIGRFAAEVISRLRGVETLPAGPPVLHPRDSLWTSWQIRRRNPDVYFSPGFNPPLSSSAPFVFTVHDLIHLDVPAESSLSKRLYYRAVVGRAVHRAHAVLTVSEFSRRRILQWSGVSPDRVHVALCGVDEHFCPRGPSHAPGYRYVLYVGNHKPHKNIVRLLRALAASGLSRDVRLLLSGDLDPTLAAEANRVRLRDAVVFAGPIPEPDLPAYYRGAEAVVLPSLYEGFGLPALEAMACGAVLVAARAAALPEVVGDAAVMVDPSDLDSIAQGLVRAVSDTRLRRELQARGPERAAGFKWDRTAAVVQSVLDRAADSEHSVIGGRERR